MGKYFQYFFRISHTVRLFAACAFLICLPSLLLAQKADTSKNLKQVDIRSANALKQESIVPLQCTTDADFGKYAAFSVADILVNFAGVNVKDYGGIGGLKTISVRSLGASHTGVLYDGVMLNDNQSGQIDLGHFNLYNLHEVSLYNGQSPQIVQPARAFAVSSIIDIRTNRPQLNSWKPYQITAGASAGSFGLVNPYMQWQQRINNRWAFIVNGNYTAANGRYKFSNGTGTDTVATRTNGDIRSVQTDGALYWTKSDSNKLKIQVNYYNSRQGLPGAVIAYVAQSAQRFANNELLAQSTYEYIAPGSFHLLLNTKYGQSYVNYRDPNFPNNNGGLNEHYTQHEFYQSVSAGYHILPHWEVSYAADAGYANLFSDAYLYAFPARLTTQNVIATAFNGGSWHLQANLLHTFITDHVQAGTAGPNQSKLTPAIMADFKPFADKGFVIRAFYKTIFRMPTFAEQYYYAYVPRNVRPEFARQYNLGSTYHKSLNGFFTDILATADAYYNNVRNKIIYLAGRSPLTPSVTNLGSVDIKGLDVTLKTLFVPAGNWQGSIALNYTYQHAVDVTNATDSYYLNQIPYTPKHLLNVNGGIGYHNWGVYYNYSFSSSRYYVSNNLPEYYLPGYDISNISAFGKFGLSGKTITTMLALNNVFNQDYVIIRSYPMPGKSVRLTLQITI